MMCCLTCFHVIVTITIHQVTSQPLTIYGRNLDGNVVTTQYGEFTEEITNGFSADIVPEILSVPPFSFMDHFNWSPGDLSEFPNLVNISSEVTDITLNDNYISHIPVNLLHILDRLTQLCIRNNLLTSFPTTTAPMKLYHLYLNGNPINEVPDFGTVAEKLRTLQIPDSHISSFRPDLSVFQALTSLNLKNSKLTDLPPCHLLPLISGSGMELMGNPFESFDTTDRNFSCVNFNEGFSGAQFTSIPNLCKTSNLPANVEWAAFPDYTMIDCDCSALWLTVKAVNSHCNTLAFTVFYNIQLSNKHIILNT